MSARYFRAVLPESVSSMPLPADLPEAGFLEIKLSVRLEVWLLNILARHLGCSSEYGLIQPVHARYSGPQAVRNFYTYYGKSERSYER